MKIEEEEEEGRRGREGGRERHHTEEEEVRGESCNNETQPEYMTRRGR